MSSCIERRADYQPDTREISREPATMNSRRSITRKSFSGPIKGHRRNVARHAERVKNGLRHGGSNTYRCLKQPLAVNAIERETS